MQKCRPSLLLKIGLLFESIPGRSAEWSARHVNNSIYFDTVHDNRVMLGGCPQKKQSIRVLVTRTWSSSSWTGSGSNGWTRSCSSIVHWMKGEDYV